MAKKITKTTEQLTEEFFADERAEYEKRVPAAFPRVPVRALSEAGEEAEPEVETGAEAQPEAETDVPKSKGKG